MPPEIEKMFIKPEMSNQIARNLSNSLTPVIEHHVKDTVAKTLIPAYQAQSSVLHQDLTREIRTEITNLKKDVINWQSEALRGQEVWNHIGCLRSIRANDTHFAVHDS